MPGTIPGKNAPKKIEKIKKETSPDHSEGFGILKPEDINYIKPYRWHDMKRSHLVALMRSMPAYSNSPAMHGLIRGVLLSTSWVDHIRNDVKHSDDSDFLIMRMKKLIQGGDYQSVSDIYNRFPKKTNAEILQLGLTAFIANGKPALACLEQKTLDFALFEEAFYKKLSAYCEHKFPAQASKRAKRRKQAQKRRAWSRSDAPQKGF